ncbi:hypothetical protein DV736_g2494, partial [Chaetothyriales sp. CBS 134916]
MSLPLAQIVDLDSWGAETNSEHARGYCVRKISDPPEWQPPQKLYNVEVQKQRIRCISRDPLLYKAEITRQKMEEYKTPELQLREPPTDPEASFEKTLEDLAQSGEEMIYIVQSSWSREERAGLGLPSVRPQANSRLFCTHHQLNGVHTPWVFLSPAMSVATCHIEDFFLQSTLFLWSLCAKIWLTIAPRHADQLEAYIADFFGLGKFLCSQFVRAENVLIPPSQLRKWGIDFSIEVLKPGSAIRTAHGKVYHQIINWGPSCAEALNCCDRAWLPPPQYQPCGRARARCNRESGPTWNDMAMGQYRLPEENDLESVPENGPENGLENGPEYVPEYVPENVPDRNSDSIEAASNCRNKKVSGGGGRGTEKGIQGGKRDTSKQRTGDPLHSERQSKRNRTKPLPAQFQEFVNRIQKSDELCQIPRVNSLGLPSFEVFRLVMALSSRSAITQFCGLVRARRDENWSRVQISQDKDPFKRIENLIENIDVGQHQSMLSQFFVRLSQFYLAEEVEKSKKPHQIRAPTPLIRQIKASFGGKRIDNYLRNGNKWRRICGPLKGLLCFFFLGGKNSFDVATTSYLDFDDKDLGAFHKFLNDPYTTAINAAGEVFIRSLNRSALDVTFRWEGGESLERKPEEEMLSLLQPL